MTVTVHLPNQLTKITAASSLNMTADSVLSLITTLVIQYPALGEYLLTSTQALTPFINIYVNQQDIRTLAYEKTVLTPGDIVTIIPAVAGG